MRFAFFGDVVGRSGRDGLAWASWEEHGAGRAPQEVPLPSDLEL